MDRPDPLDRPVLVLDFGAQYVQLIARRVRERHAFARIVRHDMSAERIQELNPLAIILSGGPSSVYEAGSPHCDPRLFTLGVPVLAICYGMQLACEALGGKVEPNPIREFGRAEFAGSLDPTDPLFQGVPESSNVWMSHGDQVQVAGEGFIPVAATATCPVAAVRHASLAGLWAPVPPRGQPHVVWALLIGNFLDRVCQSPGIVDGWTPSSTAPWRRSREVGPGDRVVCGLLRRGRLGGLRGAPGQGPGLAGGLRVRRQRPAPIGRASRRRRGVRRPLLGRAAGRRRRRPLPRGALRGVTDPQEKRIRIGHTFIDVFRDEAKSIDGATFLAQGTLYPDVIESGGRGDGPAATIKHHHNVGGLPSRAGLHPDRAPARPLQGRGPPPRPGTRPARKSWSGDTRSPAPAWPSAASAK